jgi:adenosylhomocysteinase
VIVTEIDPICALQAAMEGYEVVTLDDSLETADIFITTTGNFNIITAEHMREDEGQGDRRQHRPLRQRDRHGGPRSRSRASKKVNIKPQYDEWVFPDGGRPIMILAEGRLLNLGCATGHPSFVMSASFTNQTMAQIELHKNREVRATRSITLPKHLDEEVARLHLDKLGVKLTKLTKEQAEYIGVPVDGPYKPNHYGQSPVRPKG